MRPRAVREPGVSNSGSDLAAQKGSAPCFAERLRLSGRNPARILVLRRVKAKPSRGGREVVQEVAPAERRSLSAKQAAKP